jgi:hypothetical protein
VDRCIRDERCFIDVEEDAKEYHLAYTLGVGEKKKPVLDKVSQYLTESMINKKTYPNGFVKYTSKDNVHFELPNVSTEDYLRCGKHLTIRVPQHKYKFYWATRVTDNDHDDKFEHCRRKY